MKKEIPERVKNLIIDKYNMTLVVRHVERLELAIKRIRSQVNSGYPDKRKLNTIDLILQNVEKFI